MGQGQSQSDNPSQVQDTQADQLSPEQRAALYEANFQQAPQVAEQFVKDGREQTSNEQTINQQSQQQQQQQQYQPEIPIQSQYGVKQVEQEEQLEKREIIKKPQQQQEQQQQQQQSKQQQQHIVNDTPVVELTESDIEHIWISRLFEIVGSVPKIKSIQVTFLQQDTQLTVELMLDELILSVLQSEDFNTATKVDWLITALQRASMVDIGESGAEVGEGVLPIHKYKLLVNAICSFLTTLCLYADTLDITFKKENVENLHDQQNEIVTQIHEFLFCKDYINFIPQPLYIYLEYLNTQVSADDRTAILDMIMKRELSRFKAPQLSNTNQEFTALGLLDTLADYPNLLEPLILNSWAFGKFQLIKFGTQFQQFTVIGKLLSLSAFPSESQEWKKFAGISNRFQVEPQMNNIRSSINRLNDEVYKLFSKLLKSKLLRLKVLEYFSRIIQLNMDREKIFNQQLQMQCCSAGFVHNFVQVLLKLCLPFVENLEVIRTKVQSIDPNLISYLKLHPLLVNIYGPCDQMAPELTPFQEPESFEALPHFVTIIYLLTQRALHLQQPTIQMYIRLLEQLSKLHQNEGQSQQFQYFLAQKLAYDIQLLDKQSVRATMQFLCFECSVPFNWLKDLDHPQYPYGLLPTLFLEDLHSFLSIYTYADQCQHYMQQLSVCAEFVAITMGHRRLLNNPHLRVKGIELFYIFVPPKQTHRRKDHNLSGIFSQSQNVQDFLIEGLIKVFVDAERTGSHNQFYEKFKFRYIFCELINYLLENHQNIYATKLYLLVKKDKKLFLEFANHYLNDMIHLLDECLDKMKEMKKMEDEFANGNDSRKQNYHEFEGQLKTLALYLQEYYKNIKVFSEYEPQSFLTDEIRDKLVNNMNYTLQQINGENAIQYKTEAMNRVGFNPKFIMANVIELYINFSKDEQFLQDVVNDDRSFSLKLFENTVEKLEKHNVLLPDKIDEFNHILKILAQISMDKDQLTKALVGVPDEYIDPILGIIMTDPVQLPHSKQIVDRLTIKKILLNNKEDPFDRSMLTEDMIIEQPELQQKINQFINNKKLMMDQSKVPKEFIDPIMGITMTDPVLLPNSKRIIDRATIIKLLLTNQQDPFDKSNLTEDMLIEQPDLLLRINQYIQSTKEQRPQKIEQSEDQQ